MEVIKIENLDLADGLSLTNIEIPYVDISKLSVVTTPEGGELRDNKGQEYLQLWPDNPKFAGICVSKEAILGALVEAAIISAPSPVKPRIVGYLEQIDDTFPSDPFGITHW